MATIHRRIAVVAALAVAAIAVPRTAGAQSAQLDSRWHAWIGCWSVSQNAGTRAVCVVPAAGTTDVDITTIAAGAVSRERVRADGERRKSERDGCSGWETAKWSDDGRRVYLESEHQCSSGAKRTSHGLMTMTTEGDWLDVVSVSMDQNTGVRVLRHRPLFSAPALPAEVTAALQTVPAARHVEARTVASAPLTLADIVDASRHVNPAVVSAWLNDVRQDLRIDAKRLVQLADAGVPDRVIDMLVALAYPDAFSVPPSPSSAGLLASADPGNRGGGGGDFGGLDPLPCTSNFSVFGWDGCAPYAYSPFGIFSAAYLPYALSPYGYGGYSGGWYAGDPGVIVIRPDNAPHGQVVNGRGYTSNGTGSTATTTNTSSGSSSSGGSVSTASAPASSGGGGGGDRTAHPR